MNTTCDQLSWTDCLKPFGKKTHLLYQTKKNGPETYYVPNKFAEENLTTFKTTEEINPILDLVINAVQAANNIENNASGKKLDELIKEVKNFRTSGATIVKINRLETKFLRNPLDVIVESDEDGFIARATEFSLFGYGEDRFEAIEALKSEIESLYNDLMEDDDFTDEWLPVKHFLNEQILNS